MYYFDKGVNVMIYFKHFILLVVFSFSFLYSQVTCNQFEIKYSLDGEKLKLSLLTDLPKDTDIMVSISRSYWETGNPTQYSVDYLS